MNTKLSYLTIILTIGVLSCFSVPYDWSAEAQRSTQVMVKELESQGKENCEVWNINDFFYLPIRMNFSFEKTLSVDPDISSRGADSEGVFYEGTTETFQVVTNTAGIHTVGFILDYEVKHREPRQVYYQIYSQDNTLMMEGNWVHEGFTFCKYVIFQATEAPHILTPEEIQEQNNAFNSEFAKRQASFNTTVENALLGITITSMFGGLFLVAILIFLFMYMNRISKVANRPVKKLEEMIKIWRKMNDNQKLVTEDLINSKNDIIVKITNMISAIITDLPLVIRGKMDTIKVKESFVTPQSLIMPNSAEIYKLAERKKVQENAELSEALLTEKELKQIIDEKDRLAKIALESYESGLGVKKKVSEEKLAPQPEGEPQLNVKNHGEKTNETLETTEPQPEPELEISNEREDTVQVPPDAKCSECRKDPEIICQKCDLLFCEKHHKKHKCKGKAKPEEKKDGKKNFKEKIAEKIKKPVEKVTNLIDKNDHTPKPFDKEYIENAMEEKVNSKILDEEIIQAYLKIPYNECRKMYEEVLIIDYRKEPLDWKKIRNDACLKRLVRSAK